MYSKNWIYNVAICAPRVHLSVSQVTEIKCSEVSWARQGHLLTAMDSKGRGE